MGTLKVKSEYNCGKPYAESLRDFIIAHHGNISPTGEPNLLMYGTVRYGEGWWDRVMEGL